MIDTLILVLLGYLVFTNTQSLITAEKPWQTVDYIMLGLTVVMVAMFVLYLIRFIRKTKQQKEEAAQKREEERIQKLQADKLRKAQYLANYDELSEQDIAEIDTGTSTLTDGAEAPDKGEWESVQQPAAQEDSANDIVADSEKSESTSLYDM